MKNFVNCRRILALVLALVTMMALLAGCGGNGAPGGAHRVWKWIPPL